MTHPWRRRKMHKITDEGDAVAATQDDADDQWATTFQNWAAGSFHFDNFFFHSFILFSLVLVYQEIGGELKTDAEEGID